jgi:hypothetical protein
MAEHQSYAKHGRFDPMFHFFLIPAGVIIFFAIAYKAFRHQEKLEFVLAFWALVFVGAVFKTRLYALRNQDRIIRLEESLRLSMLLPEHLRVRIPEFTLDQLIGLRFASDAELPELAARALNEKLSRDAIKKAIKQWRPDHHRI